MRILETQVFQFDELSKEAKQNVIDKWYETEDYPFLTENLQEQLDYLDCYFSETELQYSLSYCQGDGLSFSGNFDFKKWLNDKTDLKKSVQWALCEHVAYIKSKGNNGHYAFCSKSDIDYEYEYTEMKEIEKLFEDDILPDIQDYYIQLCNQLEKSGYSELEYRMDFNEFSEHCEANLYEFTKDGELV